MLEVKNLSGGYRNKTIVKDISFCLKQGDILCLLGPNGCGKTTLFRLILGFLPAQGGVVLLRGVNIKNIKPRQLAQSIAYVPQAHHPTFAYRVIDVVLLGCLPHIAVVNMPTEQDKRRALAALSMLNIVHLANKKYTQISGGERQLILIARALCQQAAILVMDEPTANLDFANQQLILKTIKQLAAEGYTILISTHSPEHSFLLANKVLLMRKGASIAYGAPREALTSETLKNTYNIDMEIVNFTDNNNRCHYFCVPL
ncbi:MAG: ABC transporter ATP-binding protein [Bacillota bacterium]